MNIQLSISTGLMICFTIKRTTTNKYSPLIVEDVLFIFDDFLQIERGNIIGKVMKRFEYRNRKRNDIKNPQ